MVAWRATRFTSAPRSSRIFAASSWPKNAARWSAVKPSGDQAVTSSGSRVEQLLQPARPSDRGCVEDVERRVRVQQRVDEAVLAVVERVEDGREAVGVPRSGEVGIALELIAERVARRRRRSARRGSSAEQRPRQAGRAAVALARDLVAAVGQHLDACGLHPASRLVVPLERERMTRAEREHVRAHRLELLVRDLDELDPALCRSSIRRTGASRG